ncbi:unannotated protein [freshwater metagenome]|uniref:Unannotated protein n=1 Tax=freshwater metagenome TaxID=449393 RepID=A0A6J5YYG8_9ZZZZ
MKQRLKVRLEMLKSDDGMTTAEYAVGTVAAAGLGGLLIKIITSTEMKDLIWTIFRQAFGYVFG